MIGIIVSGHGNFATGIGSALELVMGKQSNLELVDFLKTDSVDDLEVKIEDSMKKMNVDGYLFLTDIAGGSPFKKCVEIGMRNNNCQTVAGTNVPMLFDIVLDREVKDVACLVEKAISAGKEHVVTFSLSKKKESNLNEETGI